MVTDPQPEQNRKAETQVSLRFVLAAVTGSVLFWLLVRRFGSFGGYAATGAFVVLAGMSMVAAGTRRHTECFSLLAYLTAVEPAFRGVAKKLPYLSLEYLVVMVAAVVVLQRRAALRVPALLLGAYLGIEVVGMAVAASTEEGRWMTVMTAARLGFLLIAARADLRTEHTLRVLVCYLAGTLAMAAMALGGAFEADAAWTTQSNRQASGGFGPNQVAGLLALGAFSALFLADVDRRPLPRMLYLTTAGVQVFAALLTFTRGGSIILALGLLVYMGILGLHGRTSIAVLGLSLVVPFAVWFAIGVTDSALVDRYSDTEMSGREGIWDLGLRIFWEHPLFGVGTGNFYEATDGRLATYHSRVGSHNELVRALTEHGIVGAVVWTSFIATGLAQCWRETRGYTRAATVSWLLMAVAFECHSGLKLGMSMLFMVLALEGFRRHAAAPVRRVRPPIRYPTPVPSTALALRMPEQAV